MRISPRRMTRQEPLDPDRVPFSEPLQLGDGTRSGAAHVEDREAPGHVEAATMQTGSLAAERVVPRAEVSPTFATERRQPGSGDTSRV